MNQPISSENTSFEELFRLHFVPLCTVAYYVVDDKDAARDIVQDFFLNYWTRRKHIRITHNFKNYAVKAVRYASLDYLKSSGKIRLEELDVLEKLAEHFQGGDKETEETRYNAVWEALSRMPEQRRKVFMMSNQEDVKYKDIAEQLGISINTVKTHIRLALSFLRDECKWLATTGTLILLLTCAPLMGKAEIGLLTQKDQYERSK